MKNVAVILAGGVGKRLGLSKPKQFVKIAGKMIIEHTVDVFEMHKDINEIAIVTHPMYYSLVEDLVVKNNWKKVSKILCGGKERYHSSLSAISAYAGDGRNINLIFHDSVRPLVSSRIITDVCETLKSCSAVDVVVPTADTIVNIGENGESILEIPNRDCLRRGQTPQAFRLETIKKAYEIALQDPKFKVTDDCGIIIKYLPETYIKVVEGEESNIKLTYPEDVYLLDKLFQIKSTESKNFDLSLFKGKVLVIFGGNSGIGKDMTELARENGAFVEVYSRKTSNVDVSNYKDVESALRSSFLAHGKIDYVINCAAILNKGPIINQTETIIRDICNINYLGAVNTTLAAYAYIKESQGQILQFTSSSYTRGRANYAMYSSTKAAVVNFVQAVADEWYDQKIRINCINPQRTKTPMRISNFGIEDDSTLLKSVDVARVALQTLLNEYSGEVIDVKIPEI